MLEVTRDTMQPGIFMLPVPTAHGIHFFLFNAGKIGGMAIHDFQIFVQAHHAPHDFGLTPLFDHRFPVYPSHHKSSLLAVVSRCCTYNNESKINSPELRGY
jgi:hypothetical protein